MSLNSLGSSGEISHSNVETNKKLQEVIQKVLALLENNEELKQDFTKKFKSTFDSITNNSEKLEQLLNSIENKMTVDLSGLHDRFRNDPNFHSEEAKAEAKSIIQKYTHMGQFALANSIKATKKEDQTA